jgi:hypothetical protein
VSPSLSLRDAIFKVWYLSWYGDVICGAMLHHRWGETTEGFIPFESLYASSKVHSEVDVASDAGFIIMHTAAVEGTREVPS